MRRLAFFLLAAVLCGCARVSAPEEPVPPVPSPTKEQGDTVLNTPTGEPDTPPVAAPDPRTEITRILAVSRLPEEPPEVLHTHPGRVRPLTASQDGRFILLMVSQGESREFTPIVLDRNSGQLTTGPRAEIDWSAVAWSGRGFWLNWLVHLDLDMRLDRYDQLRAAIGLTDDQCVLAADFSADGQTVAVLRAPRRSPSEPKADADLILANADGSDVRILKGVAQPWRLPSGPAARLRLSPDAKRLVIMAESPRAALVEVSVRGSEQWTALGRSQIGQLVPRGQWTAPRLDGPLWSPDGQYAWVPMEEPMIVNLHGTTVTDGLDKTAVGIAWTRDNAGLLLGTQGFAQFVLVRPGGKSAEVTLPHGALPVTFLPDGRILAFTQE